MLTLDIVVSNVGMTIYPSLIHRIRQGRLQREILLRQNFGADRQNGDAIVFSDVTIDKTQVDKKLRRKTFHFLPNHVGPQDECGTRLCTSKS